MILQLRLLLCLGVTVWLLPLRAFANQPSLTASLPDGALGFVEVSNLGEVVRSVRSSRALEWALATEEYQKFEKSPEYLKANAVRATAELMLGTPLWDAAEDLLKGRAAVAAYPNPENYRQPQVIALFQPGESKVFTKVRDVVKPLLAAAGKEVDAAAPGATAWSFGDKGFVALHESWFVAAQQRPLFDQTLALLGGAKDKPALAAQETVAEMERGLGGEHHVRAWVNAALVRKGLGERFGLPEKSEDGAASLIFGGLLELAARSPFAAATLDFRDKEIAGTLAIAGDPAKLPELASLWYTQHPDNGIIPLPNTPGTIAGVTIHRKFGQWYRQRDKLLADHLLPAFDKFETDIGNLLPQKDFGQDVLPLVGDNFTFTAALQDYRHLDGAPGIKLPAFAAIFDMPKPQEGADTFALFFQTLGTILNLQAGQEGRQPSVLDAEFYKETKISYSRYLQKPKGDRLPIAYNFQPAAATVGCKYIIATSVQYCRDLIDHFKNPAAEQWQNRNSELSLDFASLTKLTELNESLLRSQDIQKGQSPEAAERRVGLLITILKQLDKLRYHSSTENGMFQMHLNASWR
jgi:hypothetical protein